MEDSEEPERPAGYSNGRATRAEIVAKAAESFAQNGFHGASVRGIARAAGVDHSTLIHHFGSKTMLLLAVLEWHDAQYGSPAQSHEPDSAASIASALVAVATSNQAVPGLVQLLSVMSAEAGSPGHPARSALQGRHRTLVDVISGTIRRQRASGAVEDDGLTPEQAAAVVLATWEGLQVYDALHPGDIDLPDVLDRTLRRAFGLTSTPGL